MGVWKKALFAACCSVIVLGSSMVARADSFGPGPKPIAAGTPLSGAHPVLTFTGQFRNPTPLPAISDPDPTVCAVDCQQWRLMVDTTSPFLVSIRNARGSIDDGLNLYVYDPSGQQVGASDGVGSNGQAVAVTPTAKGPYRVVVTVTYAYDATTVYLGEARIMAPPSWDAVQCAGSSPCPVLPRLVPVPPSAFHVDGIPPVASTPLGFPFPFTVPTGNSCYVDETANSGALRCLRFTSEVQNAGAGELQLEVPWIAGDGGSVKSGFVPGGCRATQVIDLSNGKTTTRPAGTCEFHLEHGHFHYNDFVSFGLYRVRGDGSLGALVGRSLKESFCLADDDFFGFGSPGPNGPRRYSGQPGCSAASGVTQNGAWVDMGVSPGWADVYTWDTPSQYIDITRVHPGVYDVVARTNPAGALLVAGPSSVCATTRIMLTATKVRALAMEPHAACR